MKRPYVSPVARRARGSPARSRWSRLATLFRNADYNKGVLGAAVWFALGIAYFALYARKRLVLAPEEEAAIRASRGRSGR